MDDEIIQGPTLLEDRLQPAAPNRLSCLKATDTTVTLRWAGVDGVTRYAVIKDHPALLPPFGTIVYEGPYDREVCTVRHLIPDTDYEFHVLACDVDRWSQDSNHIHVRTLKP